MPVLLFLKEYVNASRVERAAPTGVQMNQPAFTCLRRGAECAMILPYSVSYMEYLFQHTTEYAVFIEYVVF